MRINISADSYGGGGQVSANDKVVSEIKNTIISQGLSEGQIFKGSIQDIIGNNVRINLGQGQTLSAILENGVKFNIGDNVSFLVKSNDGSKIFLQSVEVNGQSQLAPQLLNSLEQMGLTLSENNINMVKEMMMYNMPIDGDALARMERLVNGFPDTKAAVLVEMAAHGIPITEENISQFEAYKSYEHSMAENINNLAQELARLAEDNPRFAEALINIAKELQQGGNAADAANIAAVANGQSNQAYMPASMQANMPANMQANLPDIQTGAQEFIEDTQSEIKDIQPGIQNTDNDSVANIDVRTQGSGEAVLTESFQIKEGKTADAQDKSVQERPGNIVKADDGQPQKAEVTQAKIQISEDSEQLRSFDNKLKAAVDSIKNRWLLDTAGLEGKSGEEIKNIIKENYESMAKITDKLLEAMRGGRLEGSEAYKAAENIKNNMQFMNDISHMASYVQVPFKTYQGQANGELCVYSRDRKKTMKDGILTAFLHLDMENLGATDVRVTMEASGVNVYAQPKVTAGFTLEDTISQSIIEENLPWLKARLERLGYSVEVTSETVKEERGVFEKILEVDRPKSEVKRYGFDIRL